MLVTEDPDVIVGTETWLQSSVFSSEFLPTNYQVFRNDRITNTTGGGVFLALKNNLIAREEPEIQTNCESIWASVHIKGVPTLYFGAFYRRHFGTTALDQQYLCELESAISKLPKNCQIILAGDFNLPDVDWTKNFFVPGGRYPAISKQLINIAHDHNLHQLVTLPTRENSILDLVLTNVPSLIQNINILPGVSDHDIVSVEFLTSSDRIKQPRRKVFMFKKGNFDKISEDLYQYGRSVSCATLASWSVDQLWTGFKKVLETSIEKHIPSKMISPNCNLPWFKQSHKRSERHKRKAYDKAKQTGSLSDWGTYKQHRRSLDRSLRSSRSNYVREVGENLSTNNTKPFWKYIKSLRQSSTGVTTLNTPNGIAVTAPDKAKALNSKFQSVFNKENCDTMPVLESPPTQSMPSIKVTVEGVLKLLKELKQQKAPGPDGITPKILKECADSIAPLLQQIFQKSLDTGVLPEDWQRANISPIFKKGNRSDPANYRPISLTSIPCKILEHIIHTNIMSHLEKYHVLNNEQHGFRKGRSCETQLALTVNDLARILDDQGQADVIIMDFSKAFDLVPHQRLLLKLKHFGISGMLLDWMTNFLTKRTQKVVLDGESSSPITVTSGVPQGTVLGPLLFILYLNDLPVGIKSQVRLLADDCILYREIKSLDDSKKLQEDINTLCSWESTWQMRFNVAKCYAMHITHKKKLLPTLYKMNDSLLETVDSHTYLGVEINNKLSWAEHISKTTSKANSVLGLLRRNLYSCSSKVKETAYTTLVRPKLEYCSSIWDPYHQEHKNRLEAVQRRAARFVCNDHRRKSSVSSMIADLNWKSLEERRSIARLTLLYKSVHHTVAVDTDQYRTNLSRSMISTRKSSSISFTHPTARKNCYRYSFMPRTFVEWNLLPSQVREAPSVDSFKARLSSAKHVNI